MTYRVPALIMARAGRMRDGLQVLLATAPQIARVDLADNASDLFDIVRNTTPLLVVLDTNLTDTRILAALKTIKQVQPDTRCLVIIDNLYRQMAVKDAGADGVLLRGFSAIEFFEMVKAMLAQSTLCPTIEE